MTTIFLSSPEYYKIEYSINGFMDTKSKIDHATALAQWKSLKRALVDSGSYVIEVPPPPCPDSVFIADCGISTNDYFISSRFRAPERQIESTYWQYEFKKMGYDIIEPPEDLSFEGTGDCLIGKSVVLAGYGVRTCKLGVQFLSSIFGRKLIPVEIISSQFFHLDTCMALIGDELLLVYKEAISYESLKLLRNYFEILEVTKSEAMNFATNIIQVGHKIILQEGNDRLAEMLDKRGYEIKFLQTSEYMKAGGSCKCMSLKHHSIRWLGI